MAVDKAGGAAGGAATDGLLAEAERELAAVRSPHELNDLRARYLGRSGVLSERLRAVGKLPKEQRAAAGRENNALRAGLEELLAAARRRLEADAAAAAAAARLDVTLPGRRTAAGAVHPLQQTIARAAGILATIGFETRDGPEVETDYYNFTALNFPADHPARDMHDTLFLQDGGWLLRTHTSPVQARRLEEGGLPVRVLSPGRVFRRDNDATHSPMFHQIEGLWVDEAATFADLKGVMGEFFRAFFDDAAMQLRFRPSFFPFTEPSAECDIRRGGGGAWLEVAGCGMVHPNVLEAAGIDTGRYQGFAFGMGVERLAMLRHGVADIRLFFENDTRFLAQFAGVEGGGE